VIACTGDWLLPVVCIGEQIRLRESGRQVFLSFTKFKEETVSKHEFANELSSLRHQVGWSKAELAERLGAKRSLVEYWERNGYPNHTSLTKIIELFVREGVIPRGYAGMGRINDLWSIAGQTLPLSQRWLTQILGIEAGGWEPPVEKFSHWIILSLERMGLMQKNMAQESTVPVNILGKWVGGQTFPDPALLKTFIEFLYNQNKFFEKGFEREEILALWKAAYPSAAAGRSQLGSRGSAKRVVVEIDQEWLNRLLSKPPTTTRATE
jgi:transcriptional regulator with XRE-family HTH domain